jgi:hypothetical protein
MVTSAAHLRGMRRTVAIGLLSMGTIAAGALTPGVANADCIDSQGQVGKCVAADPATVQGGFGVDPAPVAPPRGAPPIGDLQPSTMRAFCAISACFLITDWPRAGIGGKT